MRCLVTLSCAVVAILVATLLGGCASIAHGSNQDVVISTEPTGALVKFDNGTTYTTPATVKLARKNDYVVTISKEGYQTQVVPLNSVLSGWLAGNLIFGGIIGGAIDAGTGAAYTLTPEKIALTLTPVAPGQTSASPAPGSMTTQQRLDALESLHKQGILTDVEYEASKKTLHERMKQEVMGT